MTKRNHALMTLTGLSVLLSKTMDVSEFSSDMDDPILAAKIAAIETACREARVYLRERLEDYGDC
jgi:hypothetical protein